MKTKILITGSGGFIGKALVSQLEGVSVLKVPHVHLKNAERLRSIVMNFDPTVIIHMAAYGNLASQTDEDEIVQANYTNLFNLLKASKYSNYEMFVNFSSSSVMLPNETLYSATKAGGERLCRSWSVKHNRNVLSVRPYTVIGVGEPQEHLIPTLIRSCLYGEAMPFVGSPVHDFINVNDFVAALRLIVEGWHLRGEIEIGTGVKTSNEQILKIVEKVTGKKANIERVDNLRSYDTTNWKADPTIIKSLGWEPEFTIEDTIRQMVLEEYGKSGNPQKKNTGTVKKT